MEQLKTLIVENNINEFIDLYERTDINDINDLLVCSSIYGRFNIAKFLIERGANELNEALYMSMRINNTRLVKYFIELGATNVMFALSSSIRYGNIELVKYIIQRGKGYNIDLALEIADTSIHKEIKEYLIQELTN